MACFVQSRLAACIQSFRENTTNSVSMASHGARSRMAMMEWSGLDLSQVELMVIIIKSVIRRYYSWLLSRRVGTGRAELVHDMATSPPWRAPSATFSLMWRHTYCCCIVCTTERKQKRRRLFHWDLDRNASSLLAASVGQIFDGNTTSLQYELQVRRAVQDGWVPSSNSARLYIDFWKVSVRLAEYHRSLACQKCLSMLVQA